MEFFDVLYQRQSIRSFTDKKLSQDEIKRLLDAAIHAPSACNMQSWYFYAVSDRGVLDTLCDKKGFADWAAKAPVVFVVCTDSGAIVERFGPRAEIFPVQDTALAVQNILLFTVPNGSPNFSAISRYLKPERCIIKGIRYSFGSSFTTR